MGVSVCVMVCVSGLDGVCCVQRVFCVCACVP